MADGSVRLRSGNCGFLFKRLRTGVIYTSVRGTDTGLLGQAPLDEMTAEFNRFKRPISWFVDAEHAPGVVGDVRELWTEWMGRHQNFFESLHVLTTTRQMHLTMEVAKHFSNFQRLMVNHFDRDGFEKELVKGSGQSCKVDPRWFQAEAAVIDRAVHRDGTISISNNNSSFTFKRLNEKALWSTISGIENSSLSNAPFDHMETELDSTPRKLSWYIDCSAVTRVDQSVLESWTLWALAHENKLDSMYMHVPSGALPLLIDITMCIANAHRLIHLYRSRDDFNKVCSNNSIDLEDCQYFAV